MWPSHMDVHGSAVADAKLAQCGAVVLNDTPLVYELHGTILGYLVMVIGPEREGQ